MDLLLQESLAAGVFGIFSTLTSPIRSPRRPSGEIPGGALGGDLETTWQKRSPTIPVYWLEPTTPISSVQLRIPR